MGLASENLQHKGANQNAGLTSRRKQVLLTTCAPLPGGIWIGRGGGAWCCYRPPRWTQEARGEALPPPAMYTTRQRCQHGWNPIKVLCTFPGFYFLQRYVCNFINKWNHDYFKIDISDPTDVCSSMLFLSWDILYSSKKTGKIHATSSPLT